MKNWFYISLTLISSAIVAYTSINKSKLEDHIWKLNSALLENKYKLSDNKENQLLALNTEGFSLPDSIKEAIPDNVCVAATYRSLFELLY